jgi:glycosyltransferase involved in cell wall biosynthesis
VKKKRVLFFIYEMGAGGAARTMLNIINNLDRTKFTPILVTLNYQGDYEANVAEDVLFIKLPTKRLRSAIFPLAKVIRQEKADIVFSTIPNYNTIAILGNLFSFTPAKNIVREAAFLGGSIKANLKLRLYGLLYTFASRVVALSHGVKNNIIKRYRVKDEKIDVIYNPVDTNHIQQSIEKGSLSKEYQGFFNKNEKIIMTAGRLVHDKDQQTLIKAFSYVNEQIDARLFILGEGELETELKQKAKELKIEDRVHFLGFKKNPYVYFKQADVFALTSKREGFGHVLAEALAVGVPIVATNAKPGAEEVLDNGKYGVLCEVGDAEAIARAMMKIINLSKEEREKVIAKGLERVEDFQANRITRQYEEVFERTLSK